MTKSMRHETRRDHRRAGVIILRSVRTKDETLQNRHHLHRYTRGYPCPEGVYLFNPILDDVFLHPVELFSPKTKSVERSATENVGSKDRRWREVHARECLQVSVAECRPQCKTGSTRSKSELNKKLKIGALKFK